ncbi:MAG: methylmalonyl-CoA epimerase [Candidatus Krumholzibacteriota bacterium]|nr:methylmalonyl-CoA epimerase [Candidatus Krumholzibacteriota bacterium]
MPDRLKELNHIGIAVTDLEEAKELFRDRLGFRWERDQELPERGLKIAFFSTGNTRIELLQGITADSAISKFVEKRGPGIHHLSFEVEGIQRVMDELSGEGIKLIDQQPRPGAEGHLVAFLHPKSTGSVLIELEEK